MSVHHQTCGEGREEVQALALDGKTFALSHTYADDGNYTVTVTVSDARNVSGSGTLVVTVANVAPVVGQISGAAAPLGSAAGVSTGFSDAGSADASHAATWNWGDGQTSTGQVTESGGHGTASGSHACAATGVYQVGLMVADNNGGIGQAPYQYVAVYGGNGAVATGAGWIDSPAGVYGPDPSLTGKAMFGFVSRYQKGTTRPDGRAQFRFHAAGMTFESTGYQWLVVAGAKAQFKGQGQINGSGDYGFLLSAVDGQINGGGDVDKFRIKIWDQTSGTVVYDNLTGARDGARRPRRPCRGQHRDPCRLIEPSITKSRHETFGLAPVECIVKFKAPGSPRAGIGRPYPDLGPRSGTLMLNAFTRPRYRSKVAFAIGVRLVSRTVPPGRPR